MVTSRRYRRVRGALLLTCALILLVFLPAHDVRHEAAHASQLPRQSTDNFTFSYTNMQQEVRSLREANMRREAWATAQDRIVKLERGTRMGVVVVDLSTGETVVSHRAAEPFVPASVYKLSMAVSILDSLETGGLSEGSTIAGLPVQQCLESAIVRSENECSEEWLAGLGRAGAEREAAAAGMRNTTFATYDLRTTPDDVATFLTRLYGRDLLSEEGTERLLDLMRKQQWRDGMPAVFEPQHTVANKVGFLPDVRTDAGIVYTAHGDYAVVILTEANDWPFVAEVAKPIGEVLDG